MVIDDDLVRRLVAAQFPRLADLPVRQVLPGGWDNRMFRLGDALVARLPAAESYAAQIEVELAWLPCLAPALPLPIPEPVAAGEPGCGYPWRWSVLRWLPGAPTDSAPHDEAVVAEALAMFLTALHGCDVAAAPAPGRHNFGRGGPLARYDAQAREAIARLGEAIDGVAALQHWEAAMAGVWARAPVWVHGDLWLANLLVREGRLSAVIDWGLMAAGDPACDLAIAWRGLGPVGRSALREALPMDDGTWDRARGWALWKLAITAAGMSGRAEEAPFALTALQGLLASR